MSAVSGKRGSEEVVKPPVDASMPKARPVVAAATDSIGTHSGAGTSVEKRADSSRPYVAPTQAGNRTEQSKELEAAAKKLNLAITASASTDGISEATKERLIASLAELQKGQSVVLESDDTVDSVLLGMENLPGFLELMKHFESRIDALRVMSPFEEAAKKLDLAITACAAAEGVSEANKNSFIETLTELQREKATILGDDTAPGLSELIDGFQDRIDALRVIAPPKAAPTAAATTDPTEKKTDSNCVIA